MPAELPALRRPVRAAGEELHYRLGDIGRAHRSTGPAHPVCRAAGGCHGIPEGWATAAGRWQRVARDQPGLGEHLEVTANGVGVTAEATGERRGVQRPGAAGELAEDPQPDAV